MKKRPRLITGINIWFAIYTAAIVVILIGVAVTKVYASSTSHILAGFWAGMGTQESFIVHKSGFYIFGMFLPSLVVIALLWIGVINRAIWLMRSGCIVAVLITALFGKIVFLIVLALTFTKSCRRYYEFEDLVDETE